MLKLALLAIVAVAGCLAQGRSVTLNWSDTVNPAGTTYTVKRSPGLCSGTPAFAPISAGVTGKTFTETGVAIGNQCYVVTATFQGLESQPSNTAAATVLPSKPNIDSITVAELQVNVPLLTAEEVF